MFNFQVNYEEASEGFGKIEDGKYEVLITQASEGATQGGSEYIDVRFTIRNDVQQKHANQIIFHKIWKSKETGQYVMGMVQQLAKYAQLPNGQQYATIQDFFNALLGRPLVVEVKNEESEYNGKTYENLNVKNMENTQFPNVAHVHKGQQQQQQRGQQAVPNAFGGGQQVNNEDLPF